MGFRGISIIRSCGGKRINRKEGGTTVFVSDEIPRTKLEILKR